VTLFEAKDPDFETRVRESFARQTLMQTMGARLARVAAGEVEIEMGYRGDLCQQHGFVHAGVVTAIVDSACGYAAMTLTPAGSDILTIEYKINFMSPAAGERFVGRGRVTRPGRQVTVCAGDVVAIDGGKEKTIATMLATMITLGRT